MHLKAAAALEVDGIDAALRPAMLAYHYLRALPLSGARTAIEYVNRAAEMADALLAWERAASLHEEAIQALNSYSKVDPTIQGDQLIRLAMAQHRVGRYRDSGENFSAAIMLARETGNSDLLARGVLGRGILPSMPGRLEPELVWALEEALRVIRSDDYANRSLLLARLAEALQWDDPTERRIGYSTEAVALARKTGNRATLFDVLYRVHVAIRDPDRMRLRLAYSAEMIALADELLRPANYSDSEPGLKPHLNLVIRILELSLYYAGLNRQPVSSVACDLLPDCRSAREWRHSSARPRN